MKKFSTKKFIAVLLAIVTIMTSLNLNTTEVNASSATTIDLTGVTAGSGLSHNCNNYLVTKYDTNYHWKQCTLCNAIYNKTAHSMTGYWSMGDSCSVANKYISTCSCGYSTSSANTRSHKNIGTAANYLYHVPYCFACNNEIGAQERHYDASGNILSCGNMGTCAKCGMPVNTHAINENLTELTPSISGKCYLCGNTNFIANFKMTNVSYNNNTFSFDASVTMPNGTCISENTSYSGNFLSYTGTYNVTQTISGNTAYFHVTGTSIYAGYHQMNFASVIFRLSDGTTCVIGLWAQMKAEKVVPVISNCTQTDLSVSNGWATKKQISISGTENFSNSVKITVKDSDGKIYVNNASAVVTNNNWNYSFTPNVEIGESGKVFTITVTDESGNVAEKTFTMSKVDGVTPSATLKQNTSNAWTKTKNFTAQCTDNGIGKVNSSVLNSNSFIQMNANGTSFSQNYTFTGDLYGDLEIPVIYKDGVGNSTTTYLTVSNLDNTAPTITDVSKTLTSTSDKTTKATLTVTANDINTTLNASGSGVNGYALTTTNTTPDISSFQTSNTFSVTSNGKYYLWAKDAVGNISTPKTVEIKDITISISGTITWKDNNDALGIRPDTVKISLLQNGKVIQTVDASSTYKFTNLPTTDNSYNPYTYTVEETIEVNLFDSKTNKRIQPYEITLSGYNFTNTLNAKKDVIPVYPDKNNTLKVKHNLDKNVEVTLKQITQSYDSNGNISYGIDYNGYYYNLIVGENGISLDGINNGKYEINVVDTNITLNNVTVKDNNVSVIKENGKYYVIIPQSKNDVVDTITLDLSENPDNGYGSNEDINNFFKVK